MAMRALGWLLGGLLVLVIVVYTLRTFVMPILGLPADIGSFIVFIVAIGGLCAVLFQSWRTYWGSPPAA